MRATPPMRKKKNCVEDAQKNEDQSVLLTSDTNIQGLRRPPPRKKDGETMGPNWRAGFASSISLNEKLYFCSNKYSLATLEHARSHVMHNVYLSKPVLV